MLRLSVNKNEYLMVGKDVKITFLGGNEKTLRLMIDAPKEINVARGKAIEKRAAERELGIENDCFS
ncbi:MAG: carbon storage regulator [Muribaculaceae bacterium]|nr:carbon storage regulator [Muribaculaceae bacterium]